MNKYEVMSNGIKIVIEADYYEHDSSDNIDFVVGDGEDYVGTFKDWSYVKKI